MERASLRASDADRERAVDLLRGHAAVGRLTVEELDERCSKAFSAKTFGELDELLMDLPVAPRHVICPVLPQFTSGEEEFQAAQAQRENPFQVLAKLKPGKS